MLKKTIKYVDFDGNKKEEEHYFTVVPLSNCKDCTHSLFDEKWGEYKCKVGEVRIYDLKKYVTCSFFKSKQNNLSKDQC